MPWVTVHAGRLWANEKRGLVIQRKEQGYMVFAPLLSRYVKTDTGSIWHETLEAAKLAAKGH